MSSNYQDIVSTVVEVVTLLSNFLLVTLEIPLLSQGRERGAVVAVQEPPVAHVQLFIRPPAQPILVSVHSHENSVSTTKYNIVTFLPKVLFEQVSCPLAAHTTSFRLDAHRMVVEHVGCLEERLVLDLI
jgi:hypothetical protein